MASHPIRRESAASAGAQLQVGSTGAAWTQLFRRLHFYAGILVGPLLFVAAITGLLYAFSPTLEAQWHGDLLRASTSTTTLPLEQQLGRARADHPGLPVTSVRVGRPGETTRVLLSDPSLPTDEHLAVFVDPGTGAVRGAAPVLGPTQALPARAWLLQLHRGQHLGTIGRLYLELAASWLAPLVLAGLVLWWRRRIVNRAMAMSARGRALKVHTRTGLVLALPLLFMSVTGLLGTVHAGHSLEEMRAMAGWSAPTVSTVLPDGSPIHTVPSGRPEMTPQALSRVVEAAREHHLPAPFEVTPGSPGSAWIVRESDRPFTIGADQLAVDPTTGEVTDRVRFDDWPAAAKLASWGTRAHQGQLFGLANQLLLALVALALMLVATRGYVMWWLRRPSLGTHRTLGRAPRRGALVQLLRAQPGRMVAGLVAVGALGWLLPLFGWSLALFLLVDSAIGAGLRDRCGPGS